MDLSQEDSLRINVLLNQELESIRIDESKMVVYGLTSKGEARVELNPNCKDEKYIKQIKEVISAHILGSPGGYPIFLRRWSRMGQAKDASLDRLLKLGEPEAVVAVVHASGLTDELARRAWWAMPSSTHARCMLANKKVAEGKMGKVLADFLLEFLPFEEEPRDIVESVRLVLQKNLINEEELDKLWSRGNRKNVFYVGFLKTLPDGLPGVVAAHKNYEAYQIKLQAIMAQNNVLAQQLLRSLSPAGQAYIKTVTTVLNKPSNQDVVVALLQAINEYHQPIRYIAPGSQDINELFMEINAFVNENTHSDIQEILKILPDSKKYLEALLNLSQVGVHVVNPIFSVSDAIGTVMRRQLEPVSKLILTQLEVLTK
jgi:hypothetical protein